MADGRQVLSRPVFDLTADTSLTEPDMNEARDERFNRNRTTMRMVDRHVSDQILPQTSTLSVHDLAAIKIQALYRGYLGRKKYVDHLYQQYEQEYEMQRQKTLMQMEEGDLLVQNHRLEVECEDNRTTRRNKIRQYEANVITIQRAWRRHLERTESAEGGSRVYHSEPHVDSESSVQPMSISTSIDSLRNARSEDDLLLSDGDFSQDLSAKSSRDSLLASGQEDTLAVPRPLTNKNIFIDADPESIVSDYSEMADCIKEHLANVQIIQKEDLEFENTLQNDAIVQQKITRLPGESDVDYVKRLRKLNFLSLAQEFAALKRVDSEALPFGAHKTQLASPMSEGTVSEGSDTSSATTPSEGRKDFVLHPAGTGPTTAVKEAWQDTTGHSNQSTNKQHSTQSSQVKDANPKQTSSDVHKASSQSNPHPADEPDCESKPIASANQKDKSGGSEKSSFEMQHEALSPYRHSMLKGSSKEPVSVSKGDFDVYNMECTMPTMDWDKLEHQLQKAAEEERNKKARKNDREEILRKLAMAPEEESAAYAGDRPLKKSAIQTRYHHGGQNLQVCFMNETTEEPVPAAAKVTEAPVQVTVTESKPQTIEDNLDLPSRKQKLQHEATIALAQVRPMAKMQLQVEKQVKKKSPIAEITGIPELGDGKILQLSLAMLHDMNVAQLQVILNDLHTQIEGLNMELVSMLIERDDLHMEQDSMLVDIEDLHRRAEELADRATTNMPTLEKRNDRSK